MLFGQLIAQARQNRELSLRELAQVVGTSAATLSKIESMNHLPRDPLIAALIQALKMDANETWQQVAKQRIAKYSVEVTVDPAEVPLSPVPIVGKVTAGALIEAPDWDDGGYPAGSGFDNELVPLRKDETGLYGLTVEGESMEPVFSRGDYVFAAPNKQPKNNCFAVVRLQTGEVLLKKVVFQSDTVILLSANPAFPPLSVDRQSLVYIHPITIHRFSS